MKYGGRWRAYATNMYSNHLKILAYLRLKVIYYALIRSHVKCEFCQYLHENKSLRIRFNCFIWGSGRVFWATNIWVENRTAIAKPMYSKYTYIIILLNSTVYFFYPILLIRLSCPHCYIKCILRDNYWLIYNETHPLKNQRNKKNSPIPHKYYI